MHQKLNIKPQFTGNGPRRSHGSSSLGSSAGPFQSHGLIRRLLPAGSGNHHTPPSHVAPAISIYTRRFNHHRPIGIYLPQVCVRQDTYPRLPSYTRYDSVRAKTTTSLSNHRVALEKKYFPKARPYPGISHDPESPAATILASPSVTVPALGLLRPHSTMLTW